MLPDDGSVIAGAESVWKIGSGWTSRQPQQTACCLPLVDISSTLWNIIAAMVPALGEFEQLVLLALVRLGPDAYGATVRREIETRAGRQVSISAVYTTLERLEQKGHVRSWIGEPTARRGGRRRKHFELLPSGARALKVAYKALAGMTAGLEQRLKAL